MQIACLLAEGFDDTEFAVPYSEFLKAGYRVVIVGLRKGLLNGKNRDVAIATDCAIDEVYPEDFDALFIPGGSSPDHLRSEDGTVNFVRVFAQLNRLIFAICHGPQLLVAADAIRERRLTAAKTVRSDLLRMGEEVADEEVVVDRGLVTSRQSDDVEAFTQACLRLLKDVELNGFPSIEEVSLRGWQRESSLETGGAQVFGEQGRSTR